MTSGTPLDDWLFLIGEWGGESKENQFGGEGVVETQTETETHFWILARAK
ncbi:MAG: hypothetical protein ACXAEB_15255 [Candidatus Thorarchaeota archaeon]|jgi:hypothetical protein